MNPLRLTLVLLLALAPGVAAAFDADRLADLLERDRAAQDMPGLRAAVRLPDGEIIRAAVGYANPEMGQALDDVIGMPGGSTGKTFTAVVALLLVEDGVLSLDDPVSKWLGDEPWFPRLPNADTVRVRHLLTHSGGQPDYIKSARFHTRMVFRVIGDGSAYFTPEELIGYTLKKPLFPAGEGFVYTDAGYLVLGRVIEAASGQPYYDLLEERVLRPQGLDRVRPQRESALPGIAMGHMGGSPSLRKDGRMKFDPRSEWTGGGLVTDPTMLVRFFGALVEGRILRPETVDTMIAGGWRDPEEPEWRYAMGLFVRDDPPTLAHGGLWPGYRTHVMHFRDTGVTIAVQTNRDGRLDLPGLIGRIEALTAKAAIRPGLDTTQGLPRP